MKYCKLCGELKDIAKGHNACASCLKLRKGRFEVNAQIYKSNKESLAFFKVMSYEIHSKLIMVGKNLKR